MRASRLVTLLFVLQRRRAATAAELAAELEVSERTIYRDVAALTDAGVPLWAEPGPHGGIRLVDGWRTRLDGLTAPEAAALLGVAAPQVLHDLGMGAALAGAQAKLLATMPEGMREHAAMVAERVHVDAPGWFHTPREVTALSIVAEAVWAQQRLSVRYRRGTTDVDRTLDPLGLVLKAGVWYLVALVGSDGKESRGATESSGATAAEPVGGLTPAADTAGTAGATVAAGAARVGSTTPPVGGDPVVRTYRLDRVVAASPTGGRFERPHGFDLAAHWAASARHFEGSLLRGSARLRLSPRGLRRLPLVTDAEAAHRAVSAAAPAEDGWSVVTLEHEGDEVITGQLLALGPEVEVLEPATVRAALADVAARTAALNTTV